MPLISATDLESWSTRRDAQAHLPTLVRRLVMATVVPVSVRMPAAEGVSLPGFDGIVTVEGGSPPYVPAGASVWELGTGAGKGGPKVKAEKDYAKRSKQMSEEGRAATTFVFVTSRRWADASRWAQDKAAGTDGWAGVVALDGEDLATWLAMHPGVHAWLEQEHLGRQPYGISSLGDWFSRWSAQTEPAIPAELLLCGRNEQVARLVAALKGPANLRLIAARSRDEAVAFAAAALLAVRPPSPAGGAEVPPAEEPDTEASQDDGGMREALLARALVVYEEAAWRQWILHESPLVLLPLFPDADVEAAVSRGHHVVLPRTARAGDQALLPLRRDTAREVWERAGVPFQQADDLARAAGRSLTSLRRRRGRTGRLREPAWAEGPAANLLAPLLLAGAWADDLDGDREVVLALADRGSWRGLARDLAPLSAGDDAPVTEHGHRWEFVDVLDAWDALSASLTAEDLDLAHTEMVRVLGEEDPAAALTPEERRTRALSLEGLPRRRFSGDLRRGMATTLTVLGAVTGNRILPGGRTGEDRAAAAVRELLRDADAMRWLALEDVLPQLAEAAPVTFLDAVEGSLDAADSPVMALFAEDDNPLGLTRTSHHSSLLWALETLAFSSQHLPRTAVLLGRLAELDPGGRLANRPANSLVALLHLVWPQSAVDESGRMLIVDSIRRATPQAAWRLMLALIKRPGSGLILRHGPRFRQWVRTTAAAPTYGDMSRALTDLAGRLAEDAIHDHRRWKDVLGVVDGLPPAARQLLLDAANAAWPQLDEDTRRHTIAALSERVQRHVRFRDAKWALDDDGLGRLQAFLDAHPVAGVQPADVELFGWLPRPGAPDTEDDTALLAAARAAAVQRALDYGIDGLIQLAEMTDRPDLVGESVAHLTNEHDLQLLEMITRDGKVGQLVRGFARARRLAEPTWLERQCADRPDLATALLLAGNIDRDTLHMLDQVAPEASTEFWRRVQPWQVPQERIEQVVEDLLRHDRPFSALEALWISAHRGNLPVELTQRAMRAGGRTGEDIQALTTPQYTIGQLLDGLDNAGLSPDDLAELEWLYLSLLDDDRPPRALHRRLAADPAFFAEVVCSVYRRSDDDAPAGTTDADAAEDDVPTHVVHAAWSLLHDWYAPLPGSIDGQPPTTEQVQAWVTIAKTALAAAGRGEVGSVAIGEALSGPATDPDGTWPSEVVRDVLEHERDRHVEEGLQIGRYNQRGVTTRGVYDGGAQERELEGMYRQWADRVRGRWTRAGAVLDSLADSYAADARREDESADRNRRR